MTLDVTTLERLAKLLASMDPPGLTGRGARLTQDGRSDRRQAYRALLVRWAQRRFAELDGPAAESWGPGRHASAQSTRVERKRLEFRRK